MKKYLVFLILILSSTGFAQQQSFLFAPKDVYQIAFFQWTRSQNTIDGQFFRFYVDDAEHDTHLIQANFTGKIVKNNFTLTLQGSTFNGGYVKAGIYVIFTANDGSLGKVEFSKSSITQYNQNITRLKNISQKLKNELATSRQKINSLRERISSAEETLVASETNFGNLLNEFSKTSNLIDFNSKEVWDIEYFSQIGYSNRHFNWTWGELNYDYIIANSKDISEYKTDICSNKTSFIEFWKHLNDDYEYVKLAKSELNTNAKSYFAKLLKNSIDGFELAKKEISKVQKDIIQSNLVSSVWPETNELAINKRILELKKQYEDGLPIALASIEDARVEYEKQLLKAKIDAQTIYDFIQTSCE